MTFPQSLKVSFMGQSMDSGKYKMVSPVTHCVLDIVLRAVMLCWIDKVGSLSLMLSGVAYKLIGEISHILGYEAVNNKCRFLFSLNLGGDKSSTACLVNAQR